MATLGVTYPERLQGSLIPVIGGDASIAEIQHFDSNGNRGGYGWIRSTRLAFARILGLPVIATPPTVGPFSNNATNNSVNLAVLSGSGNTNWQPNLDANQFAVTDYTDGTDETFVSKYVPTDAASKAIDYFWPSMGKGTGVGRYRINISQEATSTGFNFAETTALWGAYLKGPSQNNALPWQWGGNSGGGITAFNSGTINLADANGWSHTIVKHDTHNAAAFSSTFGELDIWNSSSNHPTSAPPTSVVLAKFATWPSRGHGYIGSWAVQAGGFSLYDAALGFAALQDEWFIWRLQAMNAATEGRDTHLWIRVRMGLNDVNESGQNDATHYQTNLETVCNRWRSIYNSQRTLGNLPTLKTITFVVDIVGQRHLSGSGAADLNFAFTGAQTAAAAVGDMVVHDVRYNISAAEALRIGDAGASSSHMAASGSTGGDHYDRREYENLSNLILAMRLSSRLRGIL